MAAGAKLTTSFARRGLIAEHGISWLLPRLIGPMNALDLLLFRAHRARPRRPPRMGLVRVLPAEGFAAAVQARAAEIANLSSPRSTRIIKKQVYEAMFQSLAEATVIANREQEICRDTEDFREGVAHYLEKREAEVHGAVEGRRQVVTGAALKGCAANCAPPPAWPDGNDGRHNKSSGIVVVAA